MRVVLQIAVQRASHRVPLERANVDLTRPARSAENDLADTERDEQPERPREAVDDGLRCQPLRLSDRPDDPAGRIWHEDAAGGVDAFQQQHRQVPPAVPADEVEDETQRRGGQLRRIRGTLNSRRHRGCSGDYR